MTTVDMAQAVGALGVLEERLRKLDAPEVERARLYIEQARVDLEEFRARHRRQVRPVTPLAVRV